MTMSDPKRQRIRDPLHNLIEFDEGDGFEGALWRVIQTPAFQRMRRIRQLGFSDFVFPGATHSRFIHSIGVYHTACRLMRIVRRDLPHNSTVNNEAEAALAAALVHDVGHGPFSHAFEEIGKHFDWKLISDHEQHSEAIIRCSDPGAIGAILNGYKPGFAEKVAGIVRGGPESVYRSVVSSQFDADRLDYIQRDRLMTGTRAAGVDFEWLMANLEIAELPANPGQTARRTFVLGSKAIHAAEAFVTGLFQMYPTVYFHKTTRGAEKLAQAMLRRVAELVRDGSMDQTGLPRGHPLIRLFEAPENLSALARVDDFVILGALPMLGDSADPLVSAFAERLISRRLFKAIDVGDLIARRLGPEADDRTIARIQERLIERIDEHNGNRATQARLVLHDVAVRRPYKKFEDDEDAINLIWIYQSGALRDLASVSAAVRATPTFRAFRAYVDEDSEEDRAFVSGSLEEVLGDEGR